MSETSSNSAPDHGVVDGAPSVPPPLSPVDPAPRLTPAEEARTLLARTNVGALATVTADRDPWASLITYGALEDGSPVLCVSRLAEHGRNLDADARASIVITQPDPPADPLAAARVTLAGRAARPAGDAELARARQVHLDAVPAARIYIDFSDFSLWVLHVERVRWVGGYGRMDSATGEQYLAAEPDPVTPAAAGAIAHLNADHADALTAMAQVFGGYPDTANAVCTDIDRYGLDLRVHTPRGVAYTRVGFPDPLSSASQLRSVTAELARVAAQA